MQQHENDGLSSLDSYFAVRFTPQRPRFQSAAGQPGQLRSSSRASSSSPRRTTKDTQQRNGVPPESPAAQKMLQVGRCVVKVHFAFEAVQMNSS
jgi:hypothetical protein